MFYVAFFYLICLKIASKHYAFFALCSIWKIKSSMPAKTLAMKMLYFYISASKNYGTIVFVHCRERLIHHCYDSIPSLQWWYTAIATIPYCHFNTNYSFVGVELEPMGILYSFRTIEWNTLWFVWKNELLVKGKKRSLERAKIAEKWFSDAKNKGVFCHKTQMTTIYF